MPCALVCCHVPPSLHGPHGQPLSKPQPVSHRTIAATRSPLLDSRCSIATLAARAADPPARPRAHQNHAEAKACFGTRKSCEVSHHRALSTTSMSPVKSRSKIPFPEKLKSSFAFKARAPALRTVSLKPSLLLPLRLQAGIAPTGPQAASKSRIRTAKCSASKKPPASRASLREKSKSNSQSRVKVLWGQKRTGGLSSNR